MAIRIIDITPKAAVRTRSQAAPLDGGIPPSRKIDSPSRKISNYRDADLNYRDAVTKKRGRPVTGQALTGAERARRYRARMKDRAAASQPL